MLELPDPNSTQMTMNCGKEYAGYLGLWITGLAFIIPAASLTLILAIVFSKFGPLPHIEGFFIGIKPAAVIGLIFSACLKLAKKGFKSNILTSQGVLVILASFTGLNEFLIISGQ